MNQLLEKVKQIGKELKITSPRFALLVEISAFLIVVLCVVVAVATAKKWFPFVALGCLAACYIKAIKKERENQNMENRELQNRKTFEILTDFIYLAMSGRNPLRHRIPVSLCNVFDSSDIKHNAKTLIRAGVPVVLVQIEVDSRNEYGELDRRVREGLQAQAINFLEDNRIFPIKWQDLDVITVTRCELADNRLRLELAYIDSQAAYLYCRDELTVTLAKEHHHYGGDDCDIDFS